MNLSELVLVYNVHINCTRPRKISWSIAKCCMSRMGILMPYFTRGTVFHVPTVLKFFRPCHFQPSGSIELFSSDAQHPTRAPELFDLTIHFRIALPIMFCDMLIFEVQDSLLHQCAQSIFNWLKITKCSVAHSAESTRKFSGPSWT